MKILPPPKHYYWSRTNFNTVESELNILNICKYWREKGHLELKIQKLRTGVGAGTFETIADQTGKNGEKT